MAVGIPWQGGACMTEGGMHSRGHAWHGGHAWHTVNKWAVRILLECILVVITIS